MQMIYCEDILYVPIHNYKNKSCYIIASVHLLHSSKTLNHLLLNNNDLPFNDLLTMLKTYACVCYENFYNVLLSLFIAVFFIDYLIGVILRLLCNLCIKHK